MRTALITGALGFCGRHLINRLQATDDIRVCGIDIANTVPPDVVLDEYVCADIRDPDELDRIIKLLKPDLVFHLAGVVSDTSFGIYHINLVGCLYLLEAIRKHAPESQTLLVGSSAEYGLTSSDDCPLTEDYPCRPVSAYGISKHASVMIGLDYARSFGLNVVVARPFNIVGAGVPETLVVGAIFKRIKESLLRNDKPLTIRMGNVDSQRDFVAVGDVADAYIKMVEGDCRGEVYNVCSGKPFSIRRIVELIASYSNIAVEIVHDPALVRCQDVPVSFGSYAKANRDFGFVPGTDIETEIAEAWRYYMEQASEA